MHNFKELKIWQRSIDMAKEISAKLQELQKMIYGFRKSLSNTIKIKNLILSVFY